MSPDIVITDEIGENGDAEAIQHLITCGVGVIASVHGARLDDVRKNPRLSTLLQGKYFQRYIVLSKENGVGTLEGIYREDFSRIYGGTL